jgi:hypothetical protein
MGIPGDRDRLSVKILWEVDRSPHARSVTLIISSSHHDALMRAPGRREFTADREPLDWNASCPQSSSTGRLPPGR